MPIMIRRKGKALKIAHAILGVPSNIAEYKNDKSSKRTRELVFDSSLKLQR